MSSSASTQPGLAMMSHGHVPHHHGFTHPTSPPQQQSPYQQQQFLQQRQRQLSGSSVESGGNNNNMRVPIQNQEQHQQYQLHQLVRQRGRTNSNNNSASNHSQYASKFSSSNSNIILLPRPTNHNLTHQQHQQDHLWQQPQHQRSQTQARDSTATTGHVAPTTVSFMPITASLQVGDQFSTRANHHQDNSIGSVSSPTLTTFAGYNQATSSSTTTTFYSGVKLAPPVLSATVIEYPQMDHPSQQQPHHRGLDMKTWYTIQVQPCDLVVPSSSSTSVNNKNKDSSVKKIPSMTSIRRKPYRIYRRYEDVVDFADQLEEEFPGLMISSRQLSSTSSSITVSTPASAMHDNGCKSSISHKGDLSSILLDSVDESSYGTTAGIHFQQHPMVTKSFTPASFSATTNTTVGALTGGNTITGTTSSSAAPNAADHYQQHQQQYGNGGKGVVALPRLKSRLVLFMTKAVCLQRKEELDRYLSELFSLGPIMAQSRLVAEFFGIWKTDMEMHLSQEDRDPLALHSGVTSPIMGADTGIVSTATTVSFAKFSAVAERTSTPAYTPAAGYYPDGPTGQLKERTQSRGPAAEDQSRQEREDNDSNRRKDTVRTGNLTISRKEDQEKKVNEGEGTNKDNGPIRRTINNKTTLDALSSLSSSMVDAVIPSSSATSSSSSSSFTSSPPPVTAPMPSSTFNLSNINASAATVDDNKPGRLLIINKAPTIHTSASDSDANTDYLASPAPSPHPTTMPKQPLFTEDMDSEMTSPTMTTADENHGDYDSTPERSPVDDIATRTLKKFKSLRRSNTLATNGSPSQQHQPHSDQRMVEPETPVASLASTTATSASSTTSPPPTSSSTQPGQPIKTKVMKRSKTAVFRTEVSMQPLSSWNVIPPWNRIPTALTTSSSGASSASSTTTSDSASRMPISPVSPVSLHDGASLISSRLNSPATEESDPFNKLDTSTTTSITVEERPRPFRMTMTHSKTMSAIATLPSLNMGSEDHVTPTAPSESSVGGTTMTKSLSANHAVQPSARLAAFSGSGARSMSVSSGTPAYMSGSSPSVASPTTAPLVAPWNRVDPNAEMNTHLHSLIKISGQPSPSILGPSSSMNNSPFVPVELGRSFLKKEAATVSALKKSNTMSQRALLEHQRVVPVLSMPPSKVKSLSSSLSSTTMTTDDTPVPKRKGMTHSISAPSGLVPKMVISAPIEPSRPSSGPDYSYSSTGNPARSRMQKRASLASSSALASIATEMDRTSSAPGAFPAGVNPSSTTTLIKKRYPRRESGPHSPTMSTKQPVGILKKTNHQPPQQTIGGRKTSLTVPMNGIFPVHPQGLHSILGTGSSSSSPVPSPTPSPGPLSSSLITTFKIVMDADTIVALQVVEDRDFVLTLTDLQSRVRTKLLKSNIELPEKFELIWTNVASASGASTAVLAVAAVESGDKETLSP
ncbi:hypothetical protein BGZ83_005660 [Gryganskiella cystojenkinii]|nr:hypothetical protein BGZ83_005660 [Gryganskiella cystojenkinii]